MNDKGSVVGDLQSYLGSSYWTTQMNQYKDGYEWVGATSLSNRPIPVDGDEETGLATKYKLEVVVDSDETIGVNLSTFVPEIRLVVELIETSEKKKRQQAVKEHICNCNNIKYVGIRSTRDMYKTISSVKEAFRKCHIYISSDASQKRSFKGRYSCCNGYV